jgi:hypothetical protein
MRDFKFFQKGLFQIFPNRYYTGERGKIMELPFPVSTLYYSINEPLTIETAILETVTVYQIRVFSMTSFLTDYRNAYIWVYAWKMDGYENYMKYDGQNIPMNEPLALRLVIR